MGGGGSVAVRRWPQRERERGREDEGPTHLEVREVIRSKGLGRGSGLGGLLSGVLMGEGSTSDVGEERSERECVAEGRKSGQLELDTGEMTRQFYRALTFPSRSTFDLDFFFLRDQESSRQADVSTSPVVARRARAGGELHRQTSSPSFSLSITSADTSADRSNSS